MNCFHLGGRAFHSRSLPLTQQGCAALNKTPAGERHTKKASLLQRSRHLHTSAFHSRTRPRPAHSSDASRAPTLTYALSHVFDSRATHARTLLPAALASVPFGFVLVRVRVRAPEPPLIAALGFSCGSRLRLGRQVGGDVPEFALQGQVQQLQQPPPRHQTTRAQRQPQAAKLRPSPGSPRASV